MPVWLIVVLIVIATHRATRVITRDAIPLIAAPREAFVQRWGTYVEAATRDEKRTSLNGKRTNGLARSIAYLWECDWCASMWVAGAITFTAYRWTSLGTEHWFTAVLVGLTASSVTGLIAERESD